MKKSSSSSLEYDFPRISISGTLILSVNIIVALVLFHGSSYGRVLWTGSLASSATMQLPSNHFVFLTSLLNVLSHSAVVLGALHDTFVISILIGVGFDVLTRGLQLYWWIKLVQIVHTISPSSSSPFMDAFFLGALSLLFLYQVYVHIRALLIVNNDSLEKMQTVLQGALNNLRGIPGDGWKDHLFAYSDLSLHLLPCWLSAILLHQQEQLHFIIPILILMAGIVSLVPLRTGNYSKDAKEELGTTKHHDLDLLQIGHFKGDPRILVCCNCKSCSHRTKSTGKKTTFVCNPVDGLCSLWMLSFEDVSTVLHQAKLRRSNSRKEK